MIYHIDIISQNISFPFVFYQYAHHFHGQYNAQKERLVNIGFNWVIAGRETKTWQEQFERLKQYKENHGKWPVKRETTGKSQYPFETLSTGETFLKLPF